MDFSKRATAERLRRNNSSTPKYFNKIFLTIFKLILVAAFLCIAFAVSAVFGAFMGVIDNTPEISMESIVPMGYQSYVYDAKGNLTDTLVMAGSNREEVVWDELPENLVNAFVAIEDARFWEHNGIDARAIIRAVRGVLTKDSSSGGGSTITQQLIKNNVFEGGHESSFGAKIERKIQEQYLAMALEKTMDKKLIMTNYLNTINLGNNTLGVKVAARRYFDKDVSELTLSECAVIAGITQNPSKLNPISGREKNAEKREVILKYMYEQGYITKEQWDEALRDNVYDRIKNVDIVTKEATTKTYSYFTDELINQVMTALEKEYNYSETQARNLIYSGGITIYSTQDPDLQAIVDEEVNNPDNYINTQYSYEYRLSVKDSKGDQKHYNESTYKTWCSENGVSYKKLFDTEDEIKEAIAVYRDALLAEKSGSEVVSESLTCTLQPQVSFVLMDQKNGEVKAISGGRGDKKVSLSLNRASGTQRQPGSTFKVLSAFGPAIDACGATLATVYYDAPYTIGSKTFKNWYSSGYYGWCNIRDGIIYSMNIIAVRCLMETVSPELGIEYCRKAGITSLTDDDYNPATALGGITYGVSNLELTGAYASIANGGMYNKPRFYTRILDHKGRVLIDNTQEESRVFKETTAFLLTDAMKDSMLGNVLYGGSVSATSTAAHLDAMSCAGKSGTTSNNNDIWFVGFTPYYTAGVWAGYDHNEQTLSGQTSFHKKIWKQIMTRVHDGLSDPGFAIPEGITTATVCRKSGKLPDLACSLDPRGTTLYTEFFEAGTEPQDTCTTHFVDAMGYVRVLIPDDGYPTVDVYDPLALMLPPQMPLLGPDGLPLEGSTIDGTPVTGINGGPGVTSPEDAELIPEVMDEGTPGTNTGPGGSGPGSTPVSPGNVSGGPVRSESPAQNYGPGSSTSNHNVSGGPGTQNTPGNHSEGLSQKVDGEVYPGLGF